MNTEWGSCWRREDWIERSNRRRSRLQDIAVAQGAPQRRLHLRVPDVAKSGGGILAQGDRCIDLRVDDHADPIPELKRLLRSTAEVFKASRAGRAALV